MNLDYYSDSSKINENEDEYDAEGDGGGGEVASARATLLGPTSSTPINTDANIPESFIVELQATARENQINNVIKSTVNNNYNTISTTPSIYDFQGMKNFHYRYYNESTAVRIYSDRINQRDLFNINYALLNCFR